MLGLVFGDNPFPSLKPSAWIPHRDSILELIDSLRKPGATA
jgi:hypothetical protein